MIPATFCSFLSKFTRLLTQKRALFKPVAKQRCFFSDPSNAASGLTLEQYRDLQRYFIKRLRATYLRFSPVPSHSVVSGVHHKYFIDGSGIYRTGTRQANQKPEQVLDLNKLVEKEQATQSQWSIQRIRLSPQEKHVAVILKEHHKEQLKCLIINLKKESVSIVSPRVILTLDKVFSCEWATDDALFYTTLDGLRSSTVFCLDLTKDRKITSVFEEPRLDVFVEVALTRDQELLTINCSNRNSSEVLLVDKTNLSCEPRLVQRRESDLLYHVEHWKGSLIILASTGPGQEYQVVRTSFSETSVASWIPLYCPPSGFTIKDMEVIRDFCVLTTRTPDGQIGLTVMSLKNPEEVYFMELPSWACSVEMKKGAGSDKTSTFQFLISSPAHPAMCFCLLPEQGLVLSDKGNERFSKDLDSFTSSRLEARSKDGTLVPVTLLHAPHEALKNVPLLVHVYGSYGRDLDVEFCPKKRFLLEQGWALAYCHVRGGGECGLSWYRQARVEGKQRSVEDLVACLQSLFSSGVSSSSLTALTACSAGAVPVGALCNLHPELIRAVTLQAPFLDLLGTLEDSSLPLTIEDREEWGDIVANPAHRLAISKYCPLHNITPQRYPSMLLTAHSEDSRVPLSGIVRYAEKLQKAIHSHLSSNPGAECEQKPKVVLHIQAGANHQGQEDFDLMINEDALELAFLYTELGLDSPHRKRRRGSRQKHDNG